MAERQIHRIFRPLKDHLPGWISAPLRSAATAVLTPITFSWRSGHFRSSLARAAVSSSGEPLPWYTYPCIWFLSQRNWAGRSVLEFGAGQSTLWWAKRAARVVALEADEAWFARLRSRVQSNTMLHLVNADSAGTCVAAVREALKGQRAFDAVVIDGLWRYEMIDIAVDMVGEEGVIICDNAEGYGFYEGFRDRDFQRVDFFGHAPGVYLPHCTSVFFRPGTFVFDPKIPIPDISKHA